MDNTQKLPRPGTGARAVIDQLQVRPLAFSDATGIYSISRRNISGHYPNKSYVGLTVLRLLRKYGHKTGKSGTKAPWVFGKDAPVSGGIFSSPPPPRQDDVCDPSDDECQDFVNDRFSLPEDDEEKFPIDSLVRYVGPAAQDHGTIGRVIGVYEGAPELRAVMWTTTEECERVDVKDLELYKAAISSKLRGSDDVGGSVCTRVCTPGFEIGCTVEYCGPDPEMRGVQGQVVGIYGSRRQVKWGQEKGPSTETLLDLKVATKPVVVLPNTLQVGQFVECKHPAGLVFPGKVFFGPTSSNSYKVVCPNGTYEWVHRDNMTPKEEKDVYNATPNKPVYEGLAPESEATRELRRQLEESLAHDKQLHWAKVSLAGMSLEQKRALREAIQTDVTLRTADAYEDD